jgi:hypothetical protein
LVKCSWGLAHPMSLTELALLDGRRPLPLRDVIGLTLSFLRDLNLNHRRQPFMFMKNEIDWYI